jgi:hypothetical protein
MNVAFLGNSYHLNKTKSADFFISLLRQWFSTVTVIAYKEAWQSLPGTKWDLLIVWQKMFDPRELEAFGAKTTVLVPMYDDCPHDRVFWEPYLGFKVLCFSQTLGADLTAWGHDCLVVKYWPQVPEQGVRIDLRGLRGFFWPRTAELQWPAIRPLLDGSPWDSFHLHLTVPEASAAPTPDEVSQFHVATTTWFDHPAEFQRVLSESSIYFVPRLYEGIGMAFLEAMAWGMCVVTPNHATMNEYIQDGVNGLYFSPGQQVPLNFSRAAELGAAARHSAIQGRQQWEAFLPHLRAFLVSTMRRPTKKHPFLQWKGRTIATLRTVFRFLKRLVRSHS